jgi:hypothetical protein
MSEKSYGSGYFGEWIIDEFGLPAYRYTCNQLEDPKAVTPTNPLWRRNNEHMHQVGNDRLVGVASNFGYVQVRQDEGSPKYLNDFYPETHQFGGGFGYLSDGTMILSTYFDGTAESFDRIFGIGYYRKMVRKDGLDADQVVYAPYGDDPVMMSQVTIKNKREEPVELIWIEYWGCQNYQFSFKALMQSLAQKTHPNSYRRGLAAKFDHNISVLGENRGLIDRQTFKGHTMVEKLRWRFLLFMLRFVGKQLTGGRQVKFPAKESVFEDLSPPPVFLLSLDAPFDGYRTDAGRFFGTGGIENPDGLHDIDSGVIVKDCNTEPGLFLQRSLSLGPNESKTLYFAFGYLPKGFDLESLQKKYETNHDKILAQSSQRWKKDRVRLELEDEEWVDRELQWHNYYLRGNLTFDSFFKEHILSQGHVYQYIIGFQGAARDPLQHALPFVYSDPGIVKNVLRYTLKTVASDGEIPYAIAGSGMYMPAPFIPSDQEMWLLWLASEYVLAYRDLSFLDELVPTYPVYGKNAGEASVRSILALCYRHLVEGTGAGRHGLQRLSNGDWNDAMVIGFAPEEEHGAVAKVGESVLNAAMASYTLDIYSRMLMYAGKENLAREVREYAEKQRIAVRGQWTGKWFRRSWLTEEIGWVGEDILWLEPQPWAIIGGAADEEKAKTLIKSIDDEVRKPTRAGAKILGRPDERMAGDPGTGTNAGVWPSITGTLIWALALIDGEMGWDEWKKNSLANRADVYPEVWYGIWSGPDTYNSDDSDRPGETMYGLEGGAVKESDDETEEGADVFSGGLAGVNWTDFPVMNMHPHAWPLYTIPKLLGIEFNRQGVDLAPTLPKDVFKFSTPLIELEKTKEGYSGMYSPKSPGPWRMTLKLAKKELDRVTELLVNGKRVEIVREGDRIVWEGRSTQDARLRWILRF